MTREQCNQWSVVTSETLYSPKNSDFVSCLCAIHSAITKNITKRGIFLHNERSP